MFPSGSDKRYFFVWIADHYSWHSALVAVVICIAAVLAVALIEIPVWTRFKKTHHHEGG